MRGTIKQARPGVWRLRIDSGANGTDKRQQLSATVYGSRRDAEKALTKLGLKADAQREQAVGAKGTLGELIELWMAHLAPRRSATTLKGYRSIIRQLPAELLRKPLAELRPTDLDAYYGERLAEGNSAQTIEHHHRLIHAALQQGIKWEMVQRNVADRADVPRVEQPPLIVPTPADVRRLIDEAARSKSPDMGDVLWLLAVTGMRRSELVNLTWGDVDWGGSRLYVRKSKNNKSRIVACHLDRLRARYERITYEDEGNRPADSEPVFNVRLDGITQFVRRLADRLDMPHVHTHSLRHFSATYAINGGADVVTVAARLGHDPAILLKRYAGSVAEADRKAGDYMGQILAGAIPLEGSQP